MISACLDSNVLISGIVFAGKPFICLEKAFRKEYQLILSSFIIEETKRNLILKFSVSHNDAELLLDKFYEVATIVEPKPFLKIIRTKDEDNRIFRGSLNG